MLAKNMSHEFSFGPFYALLRENCRQPKFVRSEMLWKKGK